MKTINIKRTVKNIGMIDTETIGSIYKADASLPFDISITWCDSKGNPLFKRCYLVRKFINNKYIMHGSFSAGKYDYYLDKINNDKNYFVGSVRDIAKDITRLNKKYNVKVLTAYNERFDRNKIEQLFNEFNIENPIKNMQWFDLMELGKEISTTKDYQNFCEENKHILKHGEESKFLTPNGAYRKTAESIYCYMINDPHFTENHTGLEDLKIENAIFHYAKKHCTNVKLDLNQLHVA